jgi:hypothetical protein
LPSNVSERLQDSSFESSGSFSINREELDSNRS